MPQTQIMAWKLRSALGETNIALDQLSRLAHIGAGAPAAAELADVISRIKKVSEILQHEAKLVEDRKTPTLKFGSDLLEHTVDFDCVKDFLQTKDENQTPAAPTIRNKEDFEG